MVDLQSNSFFVEEFEEEEKKSFFFACCLVLWKCYILWSRFLLKKLKIKNSQQKTNENVGQNYIFSFNCDHRSVHRLSRRCSTWILWIIKVSICKSIFNSICWPSNDYLNFSLSSLNSVQKLDTVHPVRMWPTLRFRWSPPQTNIITAIK